MKQKRCKDVPRRQGLSTYKERCIEAALVCDEMVCLVGKNNPDYMSLLRRSETSKRRKKST